VEEGATYLEAYWRTGLPPFSDCGGKGTCGKCQVRFLGDVPPPNPVENDLLSPVALNAGYRLACQHKVTADTTVEVVPRIGDRVVWKLEAEQAQGVELDPAVRRAPDGRVLFDGGELLRTSSPDRPILGVALDIGTTTLSGYLLNLETGAQEAALSLWNPQAAYGTDVISRIGFSMERDGGLKLLQEACISGLNRLLRGLLALAGHSEDDVLHLSVVGNPTMLHLFLGVEPGPIARPPYQPRFNESRRLEAASLGLKANPRAVVETLPLVSGYVGADSVGMALFLRLDQRSEVCLAIDVGTNGEILLSDRGQVLACSAAAGPAFEGARISCGMRAEPGAIDAVSLGLEGGRVELHIIGNGIPRGISGSGVVSTVASLLEVRLLLPSGRFVPEGETPVSWGPFLRNEGTQREFVLSFNDTRDIGSDVVVTQKDVRELQLAKAAIAAGIRRLLEYAGLAADGVDHIYLAGAFGSHLDPKAAMGIGLLPGLPLERVVAVGNAAGAGAKMLLHSRQMREAAVRMAQGIHYVELSADPKFNDLFVQEMEFPTEVSSEPSVSKS